MPASMTLTSLIKAASVLALIPHVSGACYRPDGVDRNTTPNVQPNEYQPCNKGGGHSMCCNNRFSDTCRANGLCYNAGAKLLWRESCTDPTWKDPACIKLCAGADQLSETGVPMSSIDSVITICPDNSLCCGNGDFAQRCCDAQKGFKILANGTVVEAYPSPKPVTTQAPPQTTQRNNPPPAASPTQQPTNPAPNNGSGGSGGGSNGGGSSGGGSSGGGSNNGGGGNSNGGSGDGGSSSGGSGGSDGNGNSSGGNGGSNSSDPSDNPDSTTDDEADGTRSGGRVKSTSSPKNPNNNGNDDDGSSDGDNSNDNSGNGGSSRGKTNGDSTDRNDSSFSKDGDGNDTGSGKPGSNDNKNVNSGAGNGSGNDDSENSPTSSGNGSNGALIGGVVGGVLGGLILFVLAAWYVVRRRRGMGMGGGGGPWYSVARRSELSGEPKTFYEVPGDEKQSPPIVEQVIYAPKVDKPSTYYEMEARSPVLAHPARYV